jgi:hypothetical protein
MPPEFGRERGWVFLMFNRMDEREGRGPARMKAGDEVEDTKNRSGRRSGSTKRRIDKVEDEVGRRR